MSTPPLILALDVSKTCTGAALGRVGDAPRLVSVRSTAGEDDARALKRFGIWLLDMLKVERPDYVFYEAPLQVIPGEWDSAQGRVVSKGNPRTTIALAKFVGVLEFVCESKGIALRTSHVQTVRKAFLGQGRPQNPKKHAMAMCQALGWEPRNEDEADAAAVFWHAGTIVSPRHYTPITPMLQNKVATLVDEAMSARKRRAA